MSEAQSRRLTCIVLAVEPYLMSYRSSVMAAKLLSMRLGVQLRVVNSDWLVHEGFRPYVPSFLVDLGGGRLVQIRAEENLDHREMARKLEVDIEAALGQSRSTTAATAAP